MYYSPPFVYRLILSQKSSAPVLTLKSLPLTAYRERALVICSSGGVTTSIGTEFPAASPVIMSQRVIKAVSRDKNKVKEKMLGDALERQKEV